jgi:hypothetical protein
LRHPKVTTLVWLYRVDSMLDWKIEFKGSPSCVECRFGLNTGCISELMHASDARVMPDKIIGF